MFSAEAMIGVFVGAMRARARTWRPWKSTSPSCSSARSTVRYSRSCVSGVPNATPKARIAPSVLGPTPRRRRPGATASMAATCCAMKTALRGHVGMIALPISTRSVRAAAFAKSVSGSGPVPPPCNQTAGMPARSARSISPTVSAAGAWMVTPMMPFVSFVMGGTLRTEASAVNARSSRPARTFRRDERHAPRRGREFAEAGGPAHPRRAALPRQERRRGPRPDAGLADLRRPATSAAAGSIAEQ